MNDIESYLIGSAEEELVRRGEASEALVKKVASRKEASLECQTVWKVETRERLRDNLQHPYRVKKVEEGRFFNESNDGLEVACSLFETTGTTDMDAASRLIHQVIQAQPQSGEVFNANSSLALMNGIAPKDPLEGMLAAQMTTVHNLAMEFSRRAIANDQRATVVDANLNRATKLMRTFTAQVEALNKLRTKGQQKITVQHVQVNQGGQAVIGDIKTGG